MKGFQKYSSMQHASSLIVNPMVIVGSVFTVVVCLVLILIFPLVFSLVVAVADLGTIGAGALAAIAVDGGLCGGGAVFGIIHLPAQPVYTHALLRGHLVGAHLQRDCRVVQRLDSHLLVENIPPGAWCRHASLREKKG